MRLTPAAILLLCGLFNRLRHKPDIIGGDQVEANAEIFLVELAFAHIVQMPVIDILHAMAIENIEHTVVDKIAEHDRIMQKNELFGLRCGLRKLFANGERQLQACGLPADNAFILGLDAEFAHPAARAANDFVFDQIRVVIQKRKGGNAVFLKEFGHFVDGCPPIVMVAFADELAAGQGIQKFQVFESFLQGDAPGNIAGKHDRIVFGNGFQPVFAQLLVVICPARSENIHRFFGCEG